MSLRYVPSRIVLGVASTALIVAVLVTVLPLTTWGQTTTYTLPRTADGHPDLQGIWSFASLTPMERSPEFEGRTFLTDEEVAELEAGIKGRQVRGLEDGPRRGDGVAEIALSYDPRVWKDDGRVSSRTSLIVNPPDGRIPPLTPDGKKRAPSQANRPWGSPGSAFELLPRDLIANGPEDRTLGERCILGRPSGPPLRPETYNNTVQIFQSRTHVALLNEMIHTARIIPLDDRPRDSVRQWAGQSRARWDDDTLVIETTHFRPDAAAFVTRGGSVTLRLVERISRVDDETLSYAFTIDDPATWVRPWTAQFPLTVETAMYETACHEGNYGMFNILSAARAAEREAERAGEKR